MVAETPGKVARIQDISTDVVREQIEVLLNGFPIAAIKTGMLYSSEIISVGREDIGGAREGNSTCRRPCDGRQQRRCAFETGRDCPL